VAERKVRMLRTFRARVRVISPGVTKGLAGLAEKGEIQVVTRAYAAGDLAGAALVFAATDDEPVNRAIRKEAEGGNIPVNVVDNPDLCDFIVPSLVRKGPVVIAISTSGAAPLLSKKLRQELERSVGDEYVRYARIIAGFRRILKARMEDSKVRHEIMKEVGRLSIPDIVKLGLKGMEARFIRGRQ